LEKGDDASNWEFCIKARGPMPWVPQLFYDLLTYSLAENGRVDKGMYLPLVFFMNKA
jgi:hypothetical protein